MVLIMKWMLMKRKGKGCGSSVGMRGECVGTKSVRWCLCRRDRDQISDQMATIVVE